MKLDYELTEPLRPTIEEVFISEIAAIGQRIGTRTTELDKLEDYCAVAGRLQHDTENAVIEYLALRTAYIRDRRGMEAAQSYINEIAARVAKAAYEDQGLPKERRLQ